MKTSYVTSGTELISGSVSNRMMLTLFYKLLTITTTAGCHRTNQSHVE